MEIFSVDTMHETYRTAMQKALAIQYMNSTTIVSFSQHYFKSNHNLDVEFLLEDMVQRTTAYQRRQLTMRSPLLE